MTFDQLTLVAMLAAAGAVALTTSGIRPHPVMLGRADDPSPQPRGVRLLLHVFARVEGAPSGFTRAAAAVIAGCAVLPLAVVPLPAPLGSGLIGVAVFIGLGRWSPAEVRRRDLVVQAELPGVCTLLAVCLEAGLPLRNAVTAVAEGSHGQMSSLLRRLDASVRLGVPEADAWLELGEAQPAFSALARELGHAADSGIALAPVLRHHAHEAQRAAHGAAEARARKAGVSSVVPLMVCVLPAFILIGVVPIVGGVATRMFQ